MFTTTSAERQVSAPSRAGRGLRSADRRRLERAGWRTTLEFQENHLRGESGRLVQIESSWLAEAERIGVDGVDVVCASARSESRVWAKVAAAALGRGPAGPSRAHELEVRGHWPIS